MYKPPTVTRRSHSYVINVKRYINSSCTHATVKRFDFLLTTTEHYSGFDFMYQRRNFGKIIVR
ncbi:Hypothetical predicted protein [Mytilus galloprovincialis]|uniref:Uncharacterized protein n=1 Tax=Mytilus galloprovincialis TaxID=29158 RepID=A0A8B6C7D3_MYTGA|nr:Hypothetical predicted protein [Mytilus galloprovincialis]